MTLFQANTFSVGSVQTDHRYAPHGHMRDERSLAELWTGSERHARDRTHYGFGTCSAVGRAGSPMTGAAPAAVLGATTTAAGADAAVAATVPAPAGTADVEGADGSRCRKFFT